MKGYKVFNQDWTCRGFQYKVGKTYKEKGNINLCEKGFHFCKRAVDCFKYYHFNSSPKVAEVVALGDVIEGEDKCVTNKIKIIREIPWVEVLALVNTGKYCTGYDNSGDRNSGNWNSGNWNSGRWNSGHRNSGDGNSGNWNSGYTNSGDGNSGNKNSGRGNSGDWNSGGRNSGDGNSGNWNSGFTNSGHRNSGYW